MILPANGPLTRRQMGAEIMMVDGWARADSLALADAGNLRVAVAGVRRGAMIDPGRWSVGWDRESEEGELGTEDGVEAGLVGRIEGNHALALLLVELLLLEHADLVVGGIHGEEGPMALATGRESAEGRDAPVGPVQGVRDRR